MTHSIFFLGVCAENITLSVGFAAVWGTLLVCKPRIIIGKWWICNKKLSL